MQRLNRITSHLTQARAGNTPLAHHPVSNDSSGDVDFTKKDWTVVFGDDDRYTIRLLQASDFPKGFPAILSQLTKIGNITEKRFLKQFEKTSKSLETHTAVIEDTVEGKIIASATVLIEYKFTHGCSQVGHVEDVVVDSTYRGLRLGKRIIDILKDICVAHDCYKIILDCSAKNTYFYNKLGYTINEYHMANYLKKD